MNGYTLSRNWFDWAFENPDLNTPSHTALYLWIVEKWNRCGQKEKISITTSECMEALGMSSRNTFSKVFKDLVDWKFIKIVSDSQNQYTSKVISLAQKMGKQDASTKQALDKALIQHDSKQDASTDTINKQDNKETNKQDNSLDAILSFEEFWNMYSYKEDRAKCEKLFSKTTAKDRELIKAHLPSYVKNTQIANSKVKSDLKYRKHPSTYLNQRCFVDALESKVNLFNENIFEGLRFFYKNVPSEIFIDRDKCIAIPDSVYGYCTRVIKYPEYTKLRNFLEKNGIDINNLPPMNEDPQNNFTDVEPLERLKQWIGKN